MPKALEVSLKELSISENGDIRREKASNALSVSLVYPTVGKPLVSTVKELRLKDDQTVRFTVDDNPSTNEPYTWAERVLLKEQILERAELVVQLTDVEKVAKLDRFLAKVFKKAYEALWGLATAGISNVLLGAVTESIAAVHLESFKLKGEEVRIIGRAQRELEAASLPPAGQSQDLTLELEVPKDVETVVARFNPQTHKPVRTKKKVLKKGDRNGQIVLTVRTLA